MISGIAKRNIYIFSIYLLVILAVYGNTLFNGFVYDDGYLIVENEFIRGFSRLGDMFLNDVTVTTPIGRASGYYRPVAMVFLTLSYNIWGLNTMGWHLGNVLLHLVNTFLFFLLMLRITRKDKISFISGLVFAVHPIHVESVAAIYNFMGMLATSFGLGSFLAFVKSTTEERKGHFILSVILLLLAIFSKEEIFLLPALFVMYDFYFVSKLSIPALAKKWKRYIWFVAANALYVFVRLLIVEKDAAIGFWNLNLFFNVLPATGHIWHFVTVLKVFLQYIALLLFPVNLNAFHIITPAHLPLQPYVITAIVFIPTLIAFAAYYSRRRPFISFFILAFFVSTIMISNLIPIGGLFAERLMYFPSVFYCALVGVIVGDIIEGDRATRKTASKIAVLLCCTLLIWYSLQAAARNYIWRTDILLWEDTIKKSPDSAVAHTNLAEAYYKNNLYNEAIEEYRAALRFPAPNRPLIHNKIGKIYGRKEMYDKALKEFRQALSLDARESEFYYNTGITYFHKGDFENAMLYFKQAVEKDKGYPWGYYGLGLVYEKQGKINQAIMMFENVLTLDPQFMKAREILKRIQ